VTARRFRRIVTGVLAGFGLATAVASPVFADPAGPTDYLSEVRSVEPATSAIDVGIIGGDSFFEMAVDAGTEAIVLGYEGEEYLWFRPDGIVLENQNSPATYLNADRFGNDGVPAGARADAEPNWNEVAAGGYWAWHDHRAHWMQSARPFGLSAGDQILEAVIPIVVDGDTVEVTVISTWQPAPSPISMLLGLIAGMGVAVGAWWLRRRQLPALFVAVPLVLLALGVGLAQFLSLPAATDPRTVWFVLPLIAVVSTSVGLAMAMRRQRFAADAALLLVGAELAIWGFVKRDGLSAAIIPTSLPFWLDRFATMAALAGGVSLAALALWWLFVVPVADAGPDGVSGSREPSGSLRPARP
jgi:NADH:ubiquinone oxidoreductase subunit K